MKDYGQLLVTIIFGAVTVLISYWVGIVLPNRKKKEESTEEGILLHKDVEGLAMRVAKQEEVISAAQKDINDLKLEAVSMQGMIRELTVLVNNNTEITRAITKSKIKS